jgi:D-glycero-D-manno-heptose 1,7-bisphosphate phosphatase
MTRALFLDRDGILNKIVFREGKVSSPRLLREFQVIPEAIEFVWAAKAAGFFLAVVTNQPDISRKLMTRSELKAMHEVLLSLMPLDHIEVCTSARNTCPRRKPNPGMLLHCASAFDLHLPASYFLGDAMKDVLAGKKAGVKTILLQTEYNEPIHGVGDFNSFCYKKILTIIKKQ